ncbi:MAG: murein biosynthesis integral membrane protein MurJ, partial [Bradyrhizobium sp.]|nr:murein biosynthesis integral membrane protein MurJ [Bradyrhizobium sp.]
MIRSFLTVSSGTLASRLLGFARDAMLAALLGTGAVADAFLVAFQGINVVRRLLTEGALNASLVPAWLRVRDAEGTVAAAAFAGSVLGTVGAALVAAAALIGLLMPLVMAALAPGFAATPTLQMAIDDARLMLPYLAFAGPVTVMMALLNAQGRFALTAFSPLLFNIVLIAVMAALLAWRQDAGFAALVVAGTVGAAGLLQLLMLVSQGRDTATPLRITFDAPMRGFLGKAVPGMIASAGPQLQVLGGAVIASSSPSAISWLYFANRLIELPLGLVGVAMGTVLVTDLTRGVRAGDRGAIAHAQSRGLELSVGLALPATLGLIVLAEPIVRLLFQHGAFTAADTAATAQALMWLALGLPAHVLIKALSPAFFAREDTSTPLKATATGFVVAIVFALILGQLYGAGGIAAAIALGAWSSALILIRRGAVTFGFAIDAAARRRLPRIVAAALTMGGLLWLATTFALPLAATAHGFTQAALLGVLISGGIAVYGGLL